MKTLVSLFVSAGIEVALVNNQGFIIIPCQLAVGGVGVCTMHTARSIHSSHWKSKASTQSNKGEHLCSLVLLSVAIQRCRM
jgi:hypothetical protein